MDRDRARELALQQLTSRGVGAPEGVAIVDSGTIEKPYGWIFFYNSRKFVETGELIYSLIGQGPVVVLNAGEEVIELGSAIPAEIAIRELETELLAGRKTHS